MVDPIAYNTSNNITEPIAFNLIINARLKSGRKGAFITKKN
jgi:hypothetical protein